MFDVSAIESGCKDGEWEEHSMPSALYLGTASHSWSSLSSADENNFSPM